MKNTLLRDARHRKRWNQQQLADFAGVSLSTIERAERGQMLRADSMDRICTCLEQTPEQLGLIPSQDSKISSDFNTLAAMPELSLLSHPAHIYPDDILFLYAQGIAACQDLYFGGNPHHVEAILPVYCAHTSLFAQTSSSQQRAASQLASQAHQLACELETDRENYRQARFSGQQAFVFAQLANDPNLQVAALISLANLDFHLSTAQSVLQQKHSGHALQTFLQAIALFQEQVTPLLKGRVYAGIAEVYAMRGQFQETMRAMGLAYEQYPLHPECDPAYQYLRASRYALHVFGDAQSRLFLGQPREAGNALTAMEKESNDPQIEPITKLDLLYYQSDIFLQQKELEHYHDIVIEATTLAKELGSSLYFNKLEITYHQAQAQWKHEPVMASLQECFQQ